MRTRSPAARRRSTSRCVGPWFCERGAAHPRRWLRGGRRSGPPPGVGCLRRLPGPSRPPSPALLPSSCCQVDHTDIEAELGLEVSPSDDEDEDDNEEAEAEPAKDDSPTTTTGPAAAGARTAQNILSKKVGGGVGAGHDGGGQRRDRRMPPTVHAPRCPASMAARARLFALPRFSCKGAAQTMHTHTHTPAHAGTEEAGAGGAGCDACGARRGGF